MTETALKPGPWVSKPIMYAQFREDMPNVAKAVSDNLEMLRYLGGVSHSNAKSVENELTAEFTALASLGYDGRLMKVPGADDVPLEDLLEATEDLRPSDVGEAFIYSDFWVPSVEGESITDEQLDGHRLTVARLMVYSAIEPEEGVEVDPALHYLGLFMALTQKG